MSLVGVLGGGQLGRMLALAGYPLGLCFRFLEPADEAAAGQLAEHIVAGYDDRAVLERFAAGLDLVTFEFENVPVSAARFLAERVPVYPPPAALELAQDRAYEKALFERCDIPVPPFALVSSLGELQSALTHIGTPAVLKTRRLGYDGKGQWGIHAPAEAASAAAALGDVPAIVEERIDFDREVSLLAVRGRHGDTVYYPLVENHHGDGILRRSLAPAPGLTPTLQALAERHAARLLQELNYVGVLAIEFFQVGDRLLANELAPRVHNSGHWTIEAAETSQFENHLRAILDLPLGPTAALGYSEMINLIGTVPDTAAVLAVPSAHLHLYGKAPRPGRKLGHVTVCAPTMEELAERVRRIMALQCVSS
jgi:5-(carboxyamino)imidazole ribonucleotide synthase